MDKKNPLGLRENPFKGRITVVERVYYESEQDPVREIAELAYTVFVRSDEQPWGPRRQTIGEKWVELDLGYLARSPVSELVVENLEGTKWHVQPSEEQIAALAGKVIELAVNGGVDNFVFARVRAGRACRFEPADVVWARCISGEAKVKISAAPGD